MPAWELDSTALKVLEKQARFEISPPTDSEICYAKSVGYWLENERIEHDELISKFQHFAKIIDPHDVAESFVAGLGQERVELRSALGCYVLAQCLPAHAAKLAKNFPCLICDTYLNGDPPQATLFRSTGIRARFTTGIPIDPTFGVLELEWYLAAPRATATSEDRVHFKEILTALRNAPADCAPNALSKHLGKLIGKNSIQRQHTLETLSAIGVLEPADFPSYWRAFTPYEKRVRWENRNDWEFPMRLWRGTDGVNEEAVRYWFAHLYEQ